MNSTFNLVVTVDRITARPLAEPQTTPRITALLTKLTRRTATGTFWWSLTTRLWSNLMPLVVEGNPNGKVTSGYISWIFIFEDENLRSTYDDRV